MNALRPETVAAIKADEFASKALECIRTLIYADYRDWNRLSRTGKIPFTSENAATAYCALCVLLDTDPLHFPSMDGAKVEVGGRSMPASYIEILQAAVARQPEPEPE